MECTWSTKRVRWRRCSCDRRKPGSANAARPLVIRKQNRLVDTSYIDDANTLVADHKDLPQRKAGYVYVIRDVEISGYYKIGYTKRAPSERIAEFRDELPIQIEPVLILRADADAELEEKKLHNLYSLKRWLGEWFDLRSSDIHEICEDRRLVYYNEAPLAHFTEQRFSVRASDEHGRILRKQYEQYPVLKYPKGYIYLIKDIRITRFYRVVVTRPLRFQGNEDSNGINDFGVKLPFYTDVVHIVQCDDVEKAARSFERSQGRFRLSEWLDLSLSDVQEIRRALSQLPLQGEAQIKENIEISLYELLKHGQRRSIYATPQQRPRHKGYSSQQPQIRQITSSKARQHAQQRSYSVPQQQVQTTPVVPTKAPRMWESGGLYVAVALLLLFGVIGAFAYVALEDNDTVSDLLSSLQAILADPGGIAMFPAAITEQPPITATLNPIEQRIFTATSIPTGRPTSTTRSTSTATLIPTKRPTSTPLPTLTSTPISTERPTSTPLPTSTQFPVVTEVTVVTLYVRTDGSRANVRPCPGTACTEIGKLEPGTSIQMLGEVEGEIVYGSGKWIKFIYDGHVAFVHSELTSYKE